MPTAKPTDVHAELRRVAARARRELAREWPVGTRVAWPDPYRKTVTVAGDVEGHTHDERTGEVVLKVRVLAVTRAGSDKPESWPTINAPTLVKADRVTWATA